MGTLQVSEEPASQLVHIGRNLDEIKPGSRPGRSVVKAWALLLKYDSAFPQPHQVKEVDGRLVTGASYRYS